MVPRCRLQQNHLRLRPADAKKVSPTKGGQQSTKGSKSYKGKGSFKLTVKKQVTMDQKTAEADRTMHAKAKEASKTDSPTAQCRKNLLIK